MSYSFLVVIEATVAKELAENGYVLAVQKSTAGTTDPVQWITFPVYATEISVEWLTQYGVYFTVTRIDKGAVIRQTSRADASLGRLYKYENTQFLDVGPASNPGTVSILNNAPITSVFGLSQLAYDVTGKPVTNPVAVAKGILAGTTVSFTPSETITVYFNKNYTEGGTVIDVSGPALTRTLVSGVPQKYYYDGKWSILPAAKLLALAPEIDPAFPFFEYRVVLAGPLHLWAVENFFKALLPGSKVTVTTPIWPQTGLYQLSVFGPNPTAKLEAAVGQVIDDIVREVIAAGYYELSGHSAVIESITPLPTPTSTLWNAVFKHAAK